MSTFTIPSSSHISDLFSVHHLMEDGHHPLLLPHLRPPSSGGGCPPSPPPPTSQTSSLWRAAHLGVLYYVNCLCQATKVIPAQFLLLISLQVIHTVQYWQYSSSIPEWQYISLRVMSWPFSLTHILLPSPLCSECTVVCVGQLASHTMYRTGSGNPSPGLTIPSCAEYPLFYSLNWFVTLLLGEW